MDFWKTVKLVGIIVMCMGTLIFLLDVIGYVRGNINISNGSYVEVQANMDYSQREYISITHKKRAYRWITQVTYDYNGESYTDSKREMFLFKSDDTPITIYVKKDNPNIYIYEKDVSLPKLLSILYPLVGAGIFFLAKKNEF